MGAVEGSLADVCRVVEMVGSTLGYYGGGSGYKWALFVPGVVETGVDVSSYINGG